MERSLNSLLLCLTFIVIGQTYPSGAPVDVCTTMLPGHGVEPQTSDPPYKLKIDVLSGGQLMIILASNKSGEGPYKGFLLQVRDKDDKPFGEFKPEIESKVMSCPPGQNNTITHDSDTEKYKLNFTWQCPLKINDQKYVGEAYAMGHLPCWRILRDCLIQACDA